MKIVIDLPERQYQNVIRGRWEGNPLADYIESGTPLDEVIAEIAEEICLTDNPYTGETKYTVEHLRLLEIFDHIGKEESEVQNADSD